MLTVLCLIQQGDIKTAEHTASTFEMDGRGLLELVRKTYHSYTTGKPLLYVDFT
jgi:hypothetical protein